MKKTAQPARHQGIIEVDLHATELFDDMRGLGNADILNAQVDRFREVMDANIGTPGTKIVFIHGKATECCGRLLPRSSTTATRDTKCRTHHSVNTASEQRR